MTIPMPQYQELMTNTQPHNYVSADKTVNVRAQ